MPGCTSEVTLLSLCSYYINVHPILLSSNHNTNLIQMYIVGEGQCTAITKNNENFEISYLECSSRAFFICQLGK